MSFNNTLRSFIIASLITVIAVLVEAAYYGLHPKQLYTFNDTLYSVTSPFFVNFPDIVNPLNLLLLAAVFTCSFVLASNKLAKKQRMYKNESLYKREERF